MQKHYTRTFLILITSLFLLSSCKNASDTNGYFSFTSTIQSGENLISTVRELDLNTGKTKEIWSHEYYAQYPLMVYDKQFNRVFYSHRTEQRQDELFVYDISKKESRQITQGVFAINYILPINENTVYIAGILNTSIYLNVSLYSVNLENGDILPLLENDDVHVREIYSNDFTKEIYYSHYLQSELIHNREVQSDEVPYVKPVMEISGLHSDINFGIKMNKTKRSHVVHDGKIYEIYNEYLVNSTTEPIEYIMPTSCDFLFYIKDNQIYCYNRRMILQLNLDTKTEESIYFLDYQEGAINNAIFIPMK